jgi:hypothetical protein
MTAGTPGMKKPQLNLNDTIVLDDSSDDQDAGVSRKRSKT